MAGELQADGNQQSDPGLGTVANMISLARLAAVPFFLWLLLSDEIVAATWLFMIIGITDWLDGAAARRLGQVSELGRVLDPLADRIAVAAALVGGLVADVVPAWFAWPLIVREGVMGAAAAILWLKVRATLEVRYMGKVATALVYVALPSFYVVAVDFFPSAFGTLAVATAVPGLILYYWVGAKYLLDIRIRLQGEEAAVT